jgi:hypothetical protein
MRIALCLAPVVLVAGGFLSSAWWIKQTFGETAVLIIASIAAIFVMAYSLYLSVRVQRRLDEVQKASGAASAKWGSIIGPIAFVLLLMLPQFQTGMTAIVSKLAADPGETVDTTVVTLAMTLGFVLVVILQTIATIIANAIWWNAKR